MRDVRLYFDFLSPYSWLGLKQAPAFAREHDVRFDLRPVVFGKLLDAHDLNGPGEVEVRRQIMARDVVRTAAFHGFAFQGPPAHPFRSLEALRTACLFRDDPRALELCVALADAAWAEGRDLADAGVIAEVTERLGFDAASLGERIRAPAIKAQLADYTKEAVDLGICGVPTFVLDGEVFWGQDRMDQVAARLRGLETDAVVVQSFLDRPRAVDRAASPHSAGEGGIVGRTKEPATVATLTRDLRSLGVTSGDLLIVHASLKSLGWVCGGAEAVVLALLAAVGPEGTVVLPAQTGADDPSSWRNPPVPEAWWPVIRESMPPYDPRWTGMRGMGAVAEAFRTHPGARRSAHPAWPFAAIGPLTEEILEPHDLASGLGPASPLGRLHERGARILQLGTDHDSNTSLHLAEHLGDWPGKHTRSYGAAIVRDGERAWAEYVDLELSEDDFQAVGTAFEEAHGDLGARGSVAGGTAKLLPMRELIEFAARWMSRHRGR